ncbi:hypothetical protein OI25_8271 (plasmid) [Paraburkholderia fungorum]|uniref:Uncharacterized protein n=1 Tax=Paraburkholderia fungorum TaxID=134537 RepID=A0AAU8SR64_9BURK|nr:hypothetical protein OI25_8271 [Paraburkholderia fungorum]
MSPERAPMLGRHHLRVLARCPLLRRNFLNLPGFDRAFRGCRACLAGYQRLVEPVLSIPSRGRGL